LKYVTGRRIDVIAFKHPLEGMAAKVLKRRGRDDDLSTTPVPY
jgi:hypothetical protein